MGACFSCFCFPFLCCGGAAAGSKAIPHHFQFRTRLKSPKDKRRYAIFILAGLVVTIVCSGVWYGAVAPTCRNESIFNDHSNDTIACYEPSIASCECYYGSHYNSSQDLSIPYTSIGCILPSYNTTACQEYHISGGCDVTYGTDDDTAFFPWEISFGSGFSTGAGGDNCDSPIGLATTFFCISFAAFFFFLATLYSQEERVFKEIFGYVMMLSYILST